MELINYLELIILMILKWGISVYMSVKRTGECYAAEKYVCIIHDYFHHVRPLYRSGGY